MMTEPTEMPKQSSNSFKGTTIELFQGEDELVILRVGRVYLVGVVNSDGLMTLPDPLVTCPSLAVAKKFCDALRESL